MNFQCNKFQKFGMSKEENPGDCHGGDAFPRITPSFSHTTRTHRRTLLHNVSMVLVVVTKPCSDEVAVKMADKKSEKLEISTTVDAAVPTRLGAPSHTLKTCSLRS